MSIGIPEWILIIIVALLLFGPKKLPELGRGVGKAMREFKNATSGIMSDDEEKKEESTSVQNQAQGTSPVSTSGPNKEEKKRHQDQKDR